MAAHFQIMVPAYVRGMPGHDVIDSFSVDTEEQLVDAIAARLREWVPNHSLVPVDEHALAMVLRATVRRGAR